MGAIYILWRRELKRYVRSRTQIVASLGQPLLYILALGFGLGPVFQRAGNGSYLQFLAPGVIGMTVLFSAIFSGLSLLWDRQFGFLKETLVAPVPRMTIVVGKSLGGVTVALLQGTLVVVACLIAGFRPLHWISLPQGFGYMALMALVFGGLGTALGSKLQDFQGMQLVMNFMVLPIFFFSGALFPLDHLHKLLGVVTAADPLSYGIDGLRGTLIGWTHFGLMTDAAVLAVVASVTLVIGSYFFSRIEV